jgi:hypothetical protein
MSLTTLPPQAATRLRDEAMLMLEGRGQVLETAREVTLLIRESGATAAVIGGIAVMLHGHVRATVDVDVYVEGEPGPLAARLVGAGFAFDPSRREFRRDLVPIHIVRPDQVPDNPREYVEIDGIGTVSLADLITMKLRSGSSNLLRAQDLADVIALVRRHGLGSSFAARLPKDLRPAFRKLARAIGRES